jgi:dTDP-4-dehydrorhamnose 3,5-epimerase
MHIADVRLIPLSSNGDDRGALTEVFRSEWLPEGGFVQWNAVQSAGNVVRGVHVHRQHDDYVLCLHGHAEIWLRDLRTNSETFGVVEHFEFAGLESGALFIPHGVAHGVASLRPTWLLVGESRYWAVDDELRCRWDDPDLGFEWRLDAPCLSTPDREAASFAEALMTYRSESVSDVR